MCGIVGVAGYVGPSEKKAFSLMLHFDAIRGNDSTGVVVVSKEIGQVGQIPKKTVSHDKDLGTPYESIFPYSSLFNNHHVVDEIGVIGLIGHNRAATAGEVIKDNAHPFNFAKVIGVHNGTLIRHNCSFDDNNKFPVDSQVLYDEIDRKGIHKAIGNTIGAYALVWYDKQTESMKFLRNSQRPLFYAWSKDKQTILYASEEWMITVACKKAGVSLLGEPIKFDENKLYEAELKEGVFSGGIKFVRWRDDVKPRTFHQPKKKHKPTSKILDRFERNIQITQGKPVTGNLNKGTTITAGKVIPIQKIYENLKKVEGGRVDFISPTGFHDRSVKHIDIVSKNKRLPIRLYHRGSRREVWDLSYHVGNISLKVDGWMTDKSVPIYGGRLTAQINSVIKEEATPPKSMTLLN